MMEMRMQGNTLVRLLGRLSGQMLPSRMKRRCRCTSRPCTCGGDTVMARETGVGLHNPNAIYQPGWYVKMN